MKYAQLRIGRCAPLEDRVNVLDLFARTQFIEDRIDELQKFMNKIANRDFFLFALVQHLSVESPPDSPPLVLLNQHSPV